MSFQTLDSPSFAVIPPSKHDHLIGKGQQYLNEILSTETIPVVTAKKTASGLELIQKLTAHHVPCLVILEDPVSQPIRDPSESLNTLPLKPLGVISERDIIQFQASGQSLAETLAQEILLQTSTLCLLSEDCQLWDAYQKIIQHKSSYGVVMDQYGNIVSLVSQAFLWQHIFNGTSIKQYIESLHHQLAEEKQKHQETAQSLTLAQKALEQLEKQQASQEKHSEKDLRKRKRVEAALRQTLQDLRYTQAHIIQKEKMAGLGQLIAGIAHEINNPISFIYGNLEPAQQYAEDLLTLINYYQGAKPDLSQIIQAEIDRIDLDYIDKDFPKVLNSMEMGANRIREIVKSLQNFSRLDEAKFKPIDIHQGIDNALMILQHRLMGKPNQTKICVNKQYDQLPIVECFASQLNQVFLHLISNAIDSLQLQYKRPMMDDPVPKNNLIEISTEAINNNRVVIHISDNGPGIPESCQSQIFDPFYTTKPIGQGPGLGLSISYQIIVLKHHGKLSFTSVPGEETRFTIELPCTQPKTT